MTRLDLIKEIPTGSVGAEIGVWRGYFSSQILNETAVAHLYMVDPWRRMDGYVDPLAGDDHESNMKEAMANVSGHPGRYTIVREHSPSAVANIGRMLDWVYIDADHSYAGCYADLVAWSSIVNGCVMGHDYTDKLGFGVVAAVDDFCRHFGWAIDRLTDDEWPSYKLVKK